MRCAWESLLAILPFWMREDLEKYREESLQELRLRLGAPPELCLNSRKMILKKNVQQEDILFCMNMASRYSPWTASTLSSGYITASGGHRIGFCGDVVCKNGVVSGMRNIRSICIRIARDYPGIADKIAFNSGSVLILGAPGWGKTTLLRDIIRKIALDQNVCVVDERGELFPDQSWCDNRVDVLTGCTKKQGLDICLRTMGPQWIALDEITAEEDADALIRADGCGVRVLATAHADTLNNAKKRPIYQSVFDAKIFSSVVVLHSDKTYHQERV